MKKITVVLVCLVLLISLVLAGCQMSPEVAPKAEATKETTDNTKQEGGKEKIKIGLPVYTMEHPYYIEFVEAAKKTAEEQGAELIIMDSSLDSVKQANNIENMLLQGINSLIITAIDPEGIIATLDDAAGKGVNIIVEGTPLEKNGEQYGLTFVGVDNYSAAFQGGEWAGNYAKENLQNPKIAVINFPVDPACLQRENGFKDGVKSVLGDDISIVEQNGEAVRDKSMSVMENILTADPEINLVFGINDDSALGAYSAMESRGLGSKNEAVISFDGTIDSRKEIEKNGMFKAAVFQNASDIATACILAAISAAKGETLDKNIGIPTKILTAQNVGEVK